jgi:sugar phosphate permease
VAIPAEAIAVRRDARAWRAWTLTWVSYATYYFGRKNLSVTKAAIGKALGAHSLYGVETAYLTAYAVGQYVSGWVGDRVGARKLVGVGMLVAAAASFGFGLSRAGALFLVASLVNGFAQSTGWPGNVKAMGEWTTHEERGRVMGVWATCYQVGGIAATAFATALLGYGWTAAYFGPALVLAAVGLAVLAFLRQGATSTPVGAARVGDRRDRRAVLRSPLLWSYGASYFFIKMIRYSLLFWLPYYLQTELGYASGQAGYLSTSFEIGGIAGAMGIGWISDRMPNVPRSAVCAVSLVGLACALFLYTRVAAHSPVANFAGMALVGLLLYGPDALLSGAAAQDLGGPGAYALAVGMVNGFGSTGAVLQEVVTRTVSRVWGWNAVFHVLLLFAVAAALALAPTFRSRRAPDRSIEVLD